MAKVTFISDRVLVKTMRSDDSFRVECDTGEYSLKEMQQLMGFVKGVPYRVTIEPEIEQL